MVDRPVLIAGCGDLGTRLGLRLSERGLRVVGLRRRPEGLPRPIEPLAANLFTGSGLKELAALAPGVVVVILTPAEFSDEAYRRIYVKGLETLLAALPLATPAQQLLFVSSTSVYHQDDGSWVDEHSPTRPEGFAGRRLLQAEALLRDSGLPYSSLRLGGIYGPGRDRLLRQVRAGRRHPEQPRRFSNRIHRDDAVGAMVHLLDRRAAGSELDPCYCVVDREPALLTDIERWLAARVGVDWSRAQEQPPPRRGSNKRVSSRALQTSGYRFLFPTFREGFASLLEEG